MHLLLMLSALGLAVGGGYLMLRRLSTVHGWEQRRELQLLVLVAPVVSLAIGIGGLHHFAGQFCFLDVPPWDYMLGIGLPLGMGGLAFIGVCLAIGRLALMHRTMARLSVAEAPQLQAMADQLSASLGLSPPCVLVCRYDRPLALLVGLLRPRLVLSRWMLIHLDPHELESVLAHELAHLARRDSLVAWIATLLRDAFFYLPTSWVAHRQLQREKEFACDDLAVSVTKRPLALASALGRVWQHGVGNPRFSAAQFLARAGTPTEERMKRLLATRVTDEPPYRARLSLTTGGVAMAGLVTAEVTSVAVLLAPMSCGPLSQLSKLF